MRQSELTFCARVCVFARKEKIRSCWLTQKQPCRNDGYKPPRSLSVTFSLSLLIDLPFPLVSLSIYLTFKNIILILLTLVYLAVCFLFNLFHLLWDWEKATLFCWVSFSWINLRNLSVDWMDGWVAAWWPVGCDWLAIQRRLLCNDKGTGRVATVTIASGNSLERYRK